MRRYVRSLARDFSSRGGPIGAECNNPRVANRDRHRQGLVYGPVRPSGPRDTGRIVGNLLGLLVVVVTISVLGLAIYFFLQGSTAAPPGATATPVASATSPESAAPSAQPNPSQIAGTSPTPAPSASGPVPTAAPSGAALTPGPTLFVPTVMQGPGFITFGTTVDAQLHVMDPKTTFGVDEPMVWSAYLTEPANSADLRIRILKLDASRPSGQVLVREDLVKPDATGVQIFFRRLRAIGATDGTGLFTIEYVKGDQILSTGSFLVQ